MRLKSFCYTSITEGLEDFLINEYQGLYFKLFDVKILHGYIITNQNLDV